MRKILAAVLLALGAALGALGLAVPAQADSSDEYIWALEHDKVVDFHGSKALFVNLGYRVCSDLAAGYTPGQIANFVYWNNEWGFDRAAANEVTAMAIIHLC